MVLYEKSHLHITYETDTGILQCVWIGDQTDEGIKTAGAVIINIIQENRITKILNDNRQVKGSWKDVAVWVNEDWFPAITNAGVNRFAWIYSTDVFARFSARKAAGNTAIVKFFKKVEDAVEWLEAD